MDDDILCPKYLEIIFIYHGGLSQWGRSNRPRIRWGTVKSLNAPWKLSKLVLRRDYAKKIDSCRMLVWLVCKTRNAQFVIPKNEDLRNISLGLHFCILTDLRVVEN